MAALKRGIVHYRMSGLKRINSRLKAIASSIDALQYAVLHAESR